MINKRINSEKGGKQIKIASGMQVSTVNQTMSTFARATRSGRRVLVKPVLRKERKGRKEREREIKKRERERKKGKKRKK